MALNFNDSSSVSPKTYTSMKVEMLGSLADLTQGALMGMYGDAAGMSMINYIPMMGGMGT